MTLTENNKNNSNKKQQGTHNSAKIYPSFNFGKTEWKAPPPSTHRLLFWPARYICVKFVQVPFLFSVALLKIHTLILMIIPDCSNYQPFLILVPHQNNPEKKMKLPTPQLHCRSFNQACWERDLDMGLKSSPGDDDVPRTTALGHKTLGSRSYPLFLPSPLLLLIPCLTTQHTHQDKHVTCFKHRLVDLVWL